MLRRYDVENAELILEEQKEQQAVLASQRLIELGTTVYLLYWYKSTKTGGAAGGARVATPDRTRYYSLLALLAQKYESLLALLVQKYESLLALQKYEF
jgi:hypothetical protein